jgi:dynactin-5
MDMPERYVSNKDYHLINEKNIKISKGFHAWGLNGVRIEAMDLIEENVLIRGDLNRVNIGVGTIIDAGTVLHNCLNSPIPTFDFKTLNIGSQCYIGKNCIISSRSIGNSVYIGKNCILGERSEVGCCVKILDDTYVPPDVRVPDNCVFGGYPGKYLGELCESFEQWIENYCSNFYANLNIISS